jgi:hypothetical protein
MMEYMSIDRVGAGIMADFLTDAKKEAMIAKMKSEKVVEKLH